MSSWLLGTERSGQTEYSILCVREREDWGVLFLFLFYVQEEQMEGGKGEIHRADTAEGRKVGRKER